MNELNNELSALDVRKLIKINHGEHERKYFCIYYSRKNKGIVEVDYPHVLEEDQHFILKCATRDEISFFECFVASKLLKKGLDSNKKIKFKDYLSCAYDAEQILYIMTSFKIGIHNF